MYWKVLIDGGGYTAGDVLDLVDAEAVAQVAALVPVVQVAALPELPPAPKPRAKPVPEPKQAVVPEAEPVKEPPAATRWTKGK